MFCDPEMGKGLRSRGKHRRSRDHKTYCFPEGPVNKCFINISSVKVNDSIKKTKTVLIEQNDTK